LPRRRYAIYWDWYTPAEWAKKSAEFTAEDERRKKLDAATVAFAQPGQMQAERDANEQGEETSPIQLEGRYGRRGKKWFSFDLPVDAVHPSIVLVTYSNDARRDTSFDVLAEGEKIGERRTERKSPEKPVRFFDVEYAVPPALVAGIKLSNATAQYLKLKLRRSVAWRYFKKNALRSPDVPAVGEFRRAIESAEKQQGKAKP
jgi:hypothetical protein